MGFFQIVQMLTFESKAIEDDMTFLDQKDSWDPLWVTCKNKNWPVQRFAKKKLSWSSKKK